MAKLQDNIDTTVTLVITRLIELVGWFIVINATFNNISVISWRTVLLAEGTTVSGENHRPVANL